MSAFKTWLNGLTSKSTPVDADETYLRDSEASGASKKLTWVNVKATLKTYFDTLYQAVLVSGTNIKTVNSTSLLGSGDIAISASPGGSDTQVQFNDGGAFGGDAAMTLNKTTNVLTLAGGTRTASGSTLEITETLNNSGVTFPGALVVNVTDTASNSSSLIANFTVGGVTQAKITKFGLVTVKQLTSVGQIWGQDYLLIGTSANLYLYSDAAGTLAQRNGTNPQAMWVHGTYTNGSNYRRVALAMTTAGVATLTPEGAGTGASGNVLHISGLPTSNPGAGILWNNAGTPAIGT